jgi:hypothetical protein
LIPESKCKYLKTHLKDDDEGPEGEEPLESGRGQAYQERGDVQSIRTEKKTKNNSFKFKFKLSD